MATATTTPPAVSRSVAATAASSRSTGCFER